MKKISLLLFLMVLATNVYSQNTGEERAIKITNEMSEVLSLDDDEKEKVYEIQLKRFHEVAIIRSTYARNENFVTTLQVTKINRSRKIK